MYGNILWIKLRPPCVESSKCTRIASRLSPWRTRRMELVCGPGACSATPLVRRSLTGVFTGPLYEQGGWRGVSDRYTTAHDSAVTAKVLKPRSCGDWGVQAYIDGQTFHSSYLIGQTDRYDQSYNSSQRYNHQFRRKHNSPFITHKI